MELSFLKSKIHRATVTDSNLEYEGSVTLGSELLEAAHIRPFERVEIYNIANGERFATYAIEGPPGTVCINGAAAWKAKRGDLVILATYCSLDEKEASSFRPRLVYVDRQNKITKVSDALTALGG